jgi:CBS domain containing-hemolysin-like protein
METLVGLVAIFLLVFMNGFFVAAEFAFVGSRRTRIAQLAVEGNNNAKVADKAISHLDSYIAATQLGITLASLALGWLGEPAVAQLIEPLFDQFLPEEAAATIGRTICVAIAFAFVTVLHIVLGELAPKAISLQRPEATALIVARPTTWFLMLFRPVIALMNGVGNFVVRLLGFEAAGEHSHVHSAEELEMLVHSSTQAGILQQNEEQLLRRVFDFSDVRIEEVMQPRVDVDAIPVKMNTAEVLEFVKAKHHSRYPVFDGEIDRVVGVLLAKDLFESMVRQSNVSLAQDSFNIRGVLRKPVFLPTTVGLDHALDAMQRTKMHLAIVLDEYGSMAGIVTLEDIVEQLVGDVQDEFDTDEASISADGNKFIVDGSVSMTEIIERFGELGIQPESVTIGGYVAEVLDRIPAIGDTVQFGTYQIRVVAMDGMRVSRVKFIL